MTHTYRTRPTPNADPAKLNRNKLLFGVEDYANELDKKLNDYEASGSKIRSNAVVAIEYLLSASPEFFDNGPFNERKQRLDDWCKAQIEFMKEKHGAENILNMYLHLDEKTPHIEVFVFPRDKKGKLNCREFLGGAQKLSKLQTDYAEHNKKFGLSRGLEGSRASHQTVKQFYKQISEKAAITSDTVNDIVKLDKPSIFNKLSADVWLEEQEKKIKQRVIKTFKPLVYENKLIAYAKKIKLERERMLKEKDKLLYEHEKEVESYKEQLLKQATVLTLLDIYKADNEELKEANKNLLAENATLRKQIKFDESNRKKL